MEYLESAPTTKKMIAKYIDGLLTLIVVILIRLATIDTEMDSFEFILYWFAVTFIYSLIFTTGKRNTLGRFLMKVKIVEANGSQLTFKSAFKRQVVSIFSLIAFGIGYFIGIFHDKKLTLHDRLINTRVVDLS